MGLRFPFALVPFGFNSAIKFIIYILLEIYFHGVYNAVEFW